MDGDRRLERRPRVLRADLSQLLPGRSRAVRLEAWRGSSDALDAVGSWSGTALAIAILHQHEVTATATTTESTVPPTPARAAPLVVSIGECVRRAVPTAARATIASRSPLTGFLAEGQVGGDLGRRLARFADALVVLGSTRIPGAVLVLSAEESAVPSIELCSFPDLAGADPVAIHRALNTALGPCATLRTGRAGANGVPFACLASGDDVPSFVGRGGLGAVLGRLGLSAIAIRAKPVEPDPVAAFPELTRLLARSPRLRTRAEGGTFEVAGALAAAGSLPAGVCLDAPAWKSGIDAKVRAHKGCEGCPTPCGFVFERGFPGEEARAPEARAQGGRFGALFALGPNLGLTRAEDALALLFACDAAALDAIETGSVLGLLARARGRLGDLGTLSAWIEDLAFRRGDGELLALGAQALAQELGVTGESRSARGQSARADASLAAVLGSCAGARGSDPMRTFPFLLADASPERLRELLAPIPLPPGAEDPRDPAGKGRIVWWHENLMAAIDATGFCAFSAAGLLADGVCSLDELAEAIAPAHLEPRTGRGLLAAGASIVTVARDLAWRYGARTEDDLPPWARAVLELPGMWPEYAAMRGLDADGRPSAPGWSRLCSESILEIGLDAGALAADPERTPAPTALPGPGPSRRPGTVRLRCSGPLARALGEPSGDGCVRVELELPAPLSEVLAAVARDRPRGSRHLFHDGQMIPAAYRISLRVSPRDLVQDGDELDLVVALSGG